jgi:DNA-binding PadR family transcriptional regulator
MGELDLPTTSFALLGLLVPVGETGMTGYELKQRADFTLRYYWVSPVMSQIYSELHRLSLLGYVTEVDSEAPTRYRITADGHRVLTTWMLESGVGFPLLKHPVALRLLMGRMTNPTHLREMLSQYLDDLVAHRADLQSVRTMLEGMDDARYAALVADWGLAHYDSETAIVSSLRDKIDGDNHE